MKRKITVFIAVAAPLAAVLIAAGCGSSAGGSGGSSYSVASYGSAAAASASVRSATGATKVGVASSRLGRIVVDGKGRTLYLFEKDKHGRSACYGACATHWPPLLTHGKPVARHGLKQSLLGTTRRANGSQQVTYGGHPLYRFSLDRKPGQTTGQGLQDFGGGWDVVSPAGKKIESGG
jgi:predicted lipoprotein with Yx(FWY)xxD motif